jgi:hypothetical protein
VCHQNPDSSTIPAVRAVTYQKLVDHYRIDLAAEDGGSSGPPERYALAMVEGDGPTSENYLTTASTFEDACRTAGDETLDSGRIPDAVFDLDTGDRIELHTATPVVTRSSEQHPAVNPLADEDDRGGDRK